MSASVNGRLRLRFSKLNLRSTWTSPPQPASLAAALHAERRVLARRGWVGEKSGHFEHPAYGVPIVLLEPR